MDFSSLKLNVAFNLMMKTTPILLIRLGIMLVFWLVAFIYLAIFGGIAVLLGNAVGGWLGFIVIILALIPVLPIYNLAYRYVFYMVKAAHVAVMAEMLTNENLQLPAGRGQLEWGRKRVEQRFKQMNAMFVIDEVVRGVVKAFTRTVFNIANWIPGDTIEQLVKILNRVVTNAGNFIDEAVLARSFWHEEENVWENARDGIVLYAMSWRPIIMTSVALMVISYLPGVIVFVLLFAPIGFIISIFSQALAAWTFIFMFFLAWFVKVAIGDAFATAAIIATYLDETKDLTPDPQMSAQLDQVSDQFKKLKRQAVKVATRQNDPSDIPDTPSEPITDS